MFQDFALDPWRRRFDGLGMAEEGQAVRSDQYLDASRHSGLTADQAGPFQGQDHLVHGGRRDLEMALHVSLGRRAPQAGLYRNMPSREAFTDRPSLAIH
jgi:hypothetical protein